MKQLRIGVLDLVTKAPTRALAARMLNPSLASIMPQAVAVWCEQMGHRVGFVCFTGYEDLLQELPDEMDVLFIGAFSQAAQLSYALSSLFRQRGCVTVLGGPHARCYPEDARKYFDYVVGFTDRSVIADVLADGGPHRPYGRHLNAKRQPDHLPNVRERWRFIEPTLAKSPTRIKGVPMIGSLGCPYTCSFCIDSTVPYQPLAYDELRADLRFLVKIMPNGWVGWHDPNFGVRFDDYMSVIEDSVPPGMLNFAAESSLSLLSEDHVRRLGAAGFKAMLPGIESWYIYGNKAKTGRSTGIMKVEKVSDHVNMMLRHIPYVQTNFVLGLDVDEGPEPFELTKRFIDKTPGAFPGYSLLSAFGEAAPLNLELQRAGRVRPFPFHFLNNNQAMNVQPLNYEWSSFYDHVIDLTRYSFSWRRIARRAAATPARFAKGINFIRAISTEGFGRIRYYTRVRRLLDDDSGFRSFFEGETNDVPPFFSRQVERDLGPTLWSHLPEGALSYDPLAYLKKRECSSSDEA